MITWCRSSQMLLQSGKCIFWHTVYFSDFSQRFCMQQVEAVTYLQNKWLCQMSKKETLFQHIECSYSLRPHISLQKGDKMLQILLVCLVICCSNAPFSITSNFAKHSGALWCWKSGHWSFLLNWHVSHKILVVYIRKNVKLESSGSFNMFELWLAFECLQCDESPPRWI